MWSERVMWMHSSEDHMALFFHWGDEEHARLDLLFRTPAEGSRTVAGLARKAHSSLPAQPFFLCPSPCSDSAQQIIVIQALMKSIIALVRYLMIFFIIGFWRPLYSLFLLSLTHYRNKHVFGLWMFAAVVALLCQFKKRKELYDLDAIKVGLYFFDPWGLEIFSVLLSLWSWKDKWGKLWVHLQLLYKVNSLEVHTLYWP